MAIETAVPYLIMNGKAREAIDFYETALGGKLHALQTFGEVQASCPDAMKDWVMHAELRLGQAVIFLSDGGPDERPPGGPVQIAVQFAGEARARACFDELSTGGTVVEPLFDAPWGGLFGALRDRFGVAWMFTSTPGA